ncbi:hypothetical protein PTKIN_Ptkin14bG0106500 [Pterospermum kingtungense]
MSEYLPVEVMVEILRRLPVESVVKCRSVCKRYSKNDKESLFLHFDNDDCDEFKQLHFPLAFNNYFPFFQVVGSCNGLVCLHHYPDLLDSIFWNPSIQKYIELPKPSISCYNLVFGFGFDSRTNDHKLLKVALEGKTSIKAYLFSLNENSWKRVTASFPQYAMETQSWTTGASQIATFVNGAFHWVGYQGEQGFRYRCMILGFDISTEQFFVLSLPESLIGCFPLQLLIMKYEESSIAVVKTDWEDDEQDYLWVMKKYGVVGSWAKVLPLADHSDQSGFERSPTVLGFRKNGEVLLEVIGPELASYDLNHQQVKHLGIRSKYEFTSVHSYVESLVLLDKGVDAGCVSYANHANDDSSGSDAS